MAVVPALLSHWSHRQDKKLTLLTWNLPIYEDKFQGWIADFKELHPDKTVVLINGDGSFGFNFMEVENAIRKNISLVIVICNDLGWGMIRHSQ